MDVGTTFICKACTPGHFQASGASVSCAPCPAGSYQNETGSIGCSRCPLGWHQEAEGSRNCVQCSAGATTQILGSTSVSDCGCEAGSINVAENGEEVQCIPCGEGVSCPFSSSLETLKSGQSSQGGAVARLSCFLVVQGGCGSHCSSQTFCGETDLRAQQKGNYHSSSVHSQFWTSVLFWARCEVYKH